MQTDVRAALERTLCNFERLLAGKPVRDATETIAEARAALAASPQEQAEPTDEDEIGAMAYRGNTVSYMYDRAKAYGDEIMRTWFAIKDAGLHPGRTDERLSDCVKRLLTSPKPSQAEPDAWRDVISERQRQISAEGWTPEHDDKHPDGCMATASACYALASAAQSPETNASWRMRFANAANDLWPWDREWWKPAAPRRMLVKAAALLLAEIERMDRVAAPKRTE